MKELLITVAIPAYNNEKTIQKTINSCLNQQTDIHYEILIVDDASEDNTSNIIAKYKDTKIRIVTLDKRVPIMDNHNNCLKNAYGKYVLFCHADDELERHAIETVAKKLAQRNYPNKYILWGHSMFRDSYTLLKDTGYSVNEMIVGEYAPLLFFYGAVAPTGTCYSRKSILELDGFLQPKHRMAPADLTSSLYFALHGFRFEMMDEMILIRKFASTAIHTDQASVIEALDDAFKQLLEKVNTDDIERLLNLSTKYSTRPYLIYYTLAQDSKLKPLIKKIILKDIIFNPLLLKQKLIRTLIKRVF